MTKREFQVTQRKAQVHVEVLLAAARQVLLGPRKPWAEDVLAAGSVLKTELKLVQRPCLLVRGQVGARDSALDTLRVAWTELAALLLKNTSFSLPEIVGR